MSLQTQLDAPAAARKTRTEELRLQLADEIVRGALAPGAALDETALARRFRVSRTPVREAIRLLAASGLVDARAHRAAVVARPSANTVLLKKPASSGKVATYRAMASVRAPPPPALPPAAPPAPAGR